MWAESENGDGKHLSALADVYPDQRGADRGCEHHVYPGHRHRGMDCVPPYPGCYPAHQKVETGNIILSLYEYKIFPARRFYGISGPGFLRLWGWWMGW